MKELVILMNWHKERDPEKVKAFNENKASFAYHNPHFEITCIQNLSEENPRDSWLSSDLRIFQWYTRYSIGEPHHCLMELTE